MLYGILNWINKALHAPKTNQNHHIKDLDKGVKVIKQVRALSIDLLRPKYYVTYIITSEGPKTFKVRYTCGDETGEREVTLNRTMRYVVELAVSDWTP